MPKFDPKGVANFLELALKFIGILLYLKKAEGVVNRFRSGSALNLSILSGVVGSDA